MDNVELLSYRHEFDIRNATVDARAALPGPGRPRDHPRDPPLREHGRHAPGRHRVDDHAGELVGQGRGDLRAGRPGEERGRHPLPELEGRHLDPVSPRTFGPEIIALKVRTRQSHIYVAEAARTRVYDGEGPLDVDRDLYQMQDYIQQVLAFEVKEGSPVRVEKMVAFFTSRDHAINEPLVNAGKAVGATRTFAEAFEATRGLGTSCGTSATACGSRGRRVQLLLRLHISHVLQVCSPHTADLDAGVPARGLNGEAYRGHVFWDELYIYPFLNFRLPEITRELLMYRYRRLDERGGRPKEAGYTGRCSPGRAAATARRRPRSCTSTPSRGSGSPTSATTSAT